MSESPLTELTVERINIVDSRGKLRMVISNGERRPDPVVGGRTFPRSTAPAPCLIFYNDEGDECGGLTWSAQDGQGGAALIFDRYRQQDTLLLSYHESAGRFGYGLMGYDQPDTPLADIADDMLRLSTMDAGPEKEELASKIGPVFTQRFFLGRDGDGGSKVVLFDSKGQPRIRLEVDADDDPHVVFLAADGTTVAQLP